MTTASDQTAQVAAALANDTLAALLGMELVRAEGGHVTAVATPTGEHCNAGGLVHGGYLSALADWASGCAALSGNGVSAMAPHASLSMQYIALARPGEQLTCEATCTRSGRRAATTDVTITAAGRLVAKALATHTVVAPSPSL